MPRLAAPWRLFTGCLLGVGLLLGLACDGARDQGNRRGKDALGAESTVPVSPDPTASPDLTASSNFADIAQRRGRPELMQSLRQAAAATRHPGDGGGRAWLEPPLDGAEPASVGRPGRWHIVYEAGPQGIEDGGFLFLQVSPFWGWSSPQVTAPGSVGFTEVTTDAVGVRLEASSPDQQLLAIRLVGRALASGEQVHIVYGAGPAGAIADRFAEQQSRFWVAVDADGDGVRQVLVDSPTVDVAPGAPTRLLLFLPSSARPGQPVRLTLSLVDGLGNATLRSPEVSLEGTLELEAVDDLDLGVQLKPAINLAELPRGQRVASQRVARQRAANQRVASQRDASWSLELRPLESGVLRLRGRLQTPSGKILEAESNPLQVSERGARILWADLQNHSAVSDGTGRPEELFTYARDVAALDVFSLTDHDHWGMLFYDEHQELWQEAISLSESFHQPERFVTVVGFEWTHWVHGHRHVLDFAPPYELFSSLDPRYDSPQKLWQALAEVGGPALTVAHHSAGGPVATDWSVAPDPRFEPVTEVVSVHGSSEAADSPGVIYQPVAGNFVRDALDRGYRLGFIGSTDGHDGHPGLGHLASASGGLAAILSQDLTRQGVYEALMARRTYATNGPRIVLRSTFGGYPMGTTIALDGSAAPPLSGIPANTLWTQVIAPGELDYLDVIRSGELFGRLDCEGQRTCSIALPMEDLQPTEYLYVRVVQRDGGAAWSSPFFFAASLSAGGPESGPFFELED